jgi:ATP-dependent Clp protease ATP-binding subunit ClpA
MSESAATQEAHGAVGPYTQLDSRLVERARRAIALAQDEARRYAHRYVGTEHLLLGLLGVSDGVAAAALRAMGADESRVRSAIEQVVPRGDRTDMEGEVGLTERAVATLSLAVDEARHMGHSYIGTEHLLLGMMREGDGIAAGVARRFGITLEKARAAVIDLIKQKGDVTAAKNNVITCRIDGRDMDAINALVEAGARSTRSDAAAWLIHAGIEANRDLLDKVYGTVLEIRRLREEVARSLQEPGASAK